MSETHETAVIIAAVWFVVLSPVLGFIICAALAAWLMT
jgi:hypothetical protein